MVHTGSFRGENLERLPTKRIVSRGNRACGRKDKTPPPRKTRDPKREEEECSEGTRE